MSVRLYSIKGANLTNLNDNRKLIRHTISSKIRQYIDPILDDVYDSYWRNERSESVEMVVRKKVDEVKKRTVGTMAVDSNCDCQGRTSRVKRVHNHGSRKLT